MTNNQEALTTFYKRTSSFCSVLINLRDDFQGDIDRFLIYLVILLDDISRFGDRKPMSAVGVSALSISEITGIPRESVRRKLAILLESGIVRREGFSHYHVVEIGEFSKITGMISKLIVETEAEKMPFAKM